jgi:hypothetical protein
MIPQGEYETPGHAEGFAGHLPFKFGAVTSDQRADQLRANNGRPTIVPFSAEVISSENG